MVNPEKLFRTIVDQEQIAFQDGCRALVKFWRGLRREGATFWEAVGILTSLMRSASDSDS